MDEPKWRNWQVIIGIATVLVTLGGYLISNYSHNNQPETTSALTTTTGSISITSSPTDASIYIDDTYEGETPKVLKDIEQGSHIITLKLEGYNDWSQPINVDPGKTFSLSPDLMPEGTTASEATDTPIPSAKIENIWLDNNFVYNNIQGVGIHVNFNTENLKGEKCSVVVLFYDDLTGNQLIDSDGYYAIDGKVAVWGDFTPEDVDSQYRDFFLFIPYDQFHYVGQGTAYVKYQVIISSKNEELDYSDWYTFTFIKNY